MPTVQRARRMKPGLLSDVARHVVLPSGIVSTGWPAVRDTCSGFGVSFDPWQDGAGRAILAKRADGTYAASIGGVVISIPRQVGKTFLIGAIVFALCLLFPGTTVLWTAHRLRTANETFAKMQAFARRRKVKPNIAKVVLGSGEGEIVFRNGSRILFGARERGFGRGFDDVDVEVFDESQILTDNAIDDMVPATNTAKNPLLLFLGTPPKPTDPSEVFTAKRADALSGESDDTLYIELSADRGCSPLDRQQWRKANPSCPRRTPEAAMLRMKKNLTPGSFMREGLGVWDEGDGGAVPTWSSLVDGKSRIVSHRTLALDVTPDRRWSCFGAAGRRSDGALHVEVTGTPELLDHRVGTGWVVARGVDLSKRWELPIRIEKGSPAASFVSLLREAGAQVEEVSPADHASAAGVLLDACRNDGLRHLGQLALATAVKGAELRSSGDANRWARRSSKVDISPLVAVTIALGGVPEPVDPSARVAIVLG